MLSVIQIAVILAALILGLGASNGPSRGTSAEIGPGGVPTCDGSNCTSR
jgi:hypothetical protein